MHRALALSLLLVLPLTASAAADTLVVANKSEATVSLVDLSSGEVRATLPTGQGPHEVAVSPDGRQALITDYGNRESGPGSTLTVIDIEAAKVVKTIDLGEYSRPHGILYLADGRRAVVTAEDQKAVVVVDVEAGKVVQAIGTGQEISHMIAVSPDGKRAFVANIGSGSMTALDLEKGEKLGDVVTGDGAEGVDVAAGGKEVWVTNRAADTVTVVDAQSLKILSSLESPSFPIRAKATPDGKKILVTNARSGDLAIFDVAKRGLAQRIKLEVAAADTSDRLFGNRFGDSSVPIGIVVSPDGSRAFIAHAYADVISIVDLEKGTQAGKLRAGREPDGMAYSTVAVKAVEGGADDAEDPAG